MAVSISALPRTQSHIHPMGFKIAEDDVSPPPGPVGGIHIASISRFGKVLIFPFHDHGGGSWPAVAVAVLTSVALINVPVIVPVVAYIFVKLCTTEPLGQISSSGWSSPPRIGNLLRFTSSTATDPK